VAGRASALGQAGDPAVAGDGGQEEIPGMIGGDHLNLEGAFAAGLGGDAFHGEGAIPRLGQGGKRGA
jgi:hypothetical protein